MHDRELALFEVPSVRSTRFVERATRIVAAVLFGSVATISVVATSVPFDSSVPVSGFLEPREELFAHAEEGGLVSHVFVDTGDTVTVGQPLLQIESAEAKLELLRVELEIAELKHSVYAKLLRQDNDGQARRAELASALARLTQARAATRQRLIEFGQSDSLDVIRQRHVVGSHVELDRVLAGLEAAEADVDLSRTRLAALDIERKVDEGDQRRIATLKEQQAFLHARSQRRVVRAPGDGIVTTPKFRSLLGSAVSAGQRVGILVEPGQWVVRAPLTEGKIIEIASGNAVKLELLAFGADRSEHMDGHVTRIEPSDVARSGGASPLQYEVVIRLDSIAPAIQAQLRSGMSVAGRIITLRTTLMRHIWSRLLSRAGDRR